MNLQAKVFDIEEGKGCKLSISPFLAYPLCHHALSSYVISNLLLAMALLSCDGLCSFLLSRAVEDVTPGIHTAAKYGYPDRGWAGPTTPDRIHTDYLLRKSS